VVSSVAHVSEILSRDSHQMSMKGRHAAAKLRRSMNGFITDIPLTLFHLMANMIRWQAEWPQVEILRNHSV
jgi:hypothetical protein